MSAVAKFYQMSILSQTFGLLHSLLERAVLPNLCVGRGDQECREPAEGCHGSLVE